MDELTRLLLFTTATGACIPLGAALARFEHLRPGWLDNELRHFVIAFGGGILLGAVARVLVPEGTRQIGSTLGAAAVLMAGGIVYMLLERRRGSRGKTSPQLTAMLSDYVPESLALGGMFAMSAEGALLLAVLIGLQNIPEAFNSYRELVTERPGSENAVTLRMIALVPLGPLCGLVGWLALAQWPGGIGEGVLGGVMLFASGGILYLTFQDIAPQARLERHWAPPLGAVLGFAFAMAGDLLVHG